ncbi:MAG TPA: isopentenyl transferase family protein [Streptosporangiaceae bacterium]|nr:isopentenyl transferase family protein [Streptosporangiaceae bacterium]
MSLPGRDQSLHLVLGPTASAKTGHAIMLAAAVGAPVVAIDRIQVFDDLATISGRPTAAELNGTRRVYLDHRLLREAKTDLTVAEGLARLRRLIGRLGPAVVLEGGSISLWQAIFATLDNGRIEPHLRLVEDWDAHAAAIEDRCVAMMTIARPSMLDELAAALTEPAMRRVAIELIGVKAILGWCEDHGVPPATLGAYNEDAGVARSLARAMRPALVAHARRQQDVFRALLAGRPHELEVVR